MGDEKIQVNGKIPLDGHLHEYLIVFFTKSEKSSNHFFNNLRILNKDQRFKSKGMKKPARGKKKSR